MDSSLDVTRVVGVLLMDGQWRKIEDESFNLYIGDFIHEGRSVFREAKVPPAIIAKWRAPLAGEWYVCPLSSIVAYRFKEKDDSN